MDHHSSSHVFRPKTWGLFWYRQHFDDASHYKKGCHKWRTCYIWHLRTINVGLGICKTVKGLEKNKGSEFYYVSLCMEEELSSNTDLTISKWFHVKICIDTCYLKRCELPEYEVQILCNLCCLMVFCPELWVLR